MERPDWKPKDSLRSAVDIGKLAMAEIINLTGRAKRERVTVHYPSYAVEAPVQHEADLLQGRLPLWEEEDEM